MGKCRVEPQLDMTAPIPQWLSVKGQQYAKSWRSCGVIGTPTYSSGNVK